jgi:hypothetical protein
MLFHNAVSIAEYISRRLTNGGSRILQGTIFALHSACSCHTDPFIAAVLNGSFAFMFSYWRYKFTV